MWAQIAMAAVNVVEGWSMAGTKRKVARAEYGLQKAQYELDKVRGQGRDLAVAGQNMLAMAQASYADFEKRRNNKKALQAYGEAVSQEAWNASRQANAMNNQKFEANLQNAGNLGRITAAASAAGVGGSSVDAVYQTEVMRQQRQEQAAADQMADWQYARNLNQISMMDNIWNSLDMSANFANVTYKANELVVDNTFDNSWQHKYTIGKAAMDGMNGFMGNMNNIGLNVQDFGFKGQNIFGGGGSSGQATGQMNKGLGQGGAVRL
ncbi:internal virion protein [Cronobacter phage Dev-CD-23823]|uniref:Internal virion protein n=1 Tax=Cronobacter phage Dev-CD-23823 TaxID=1712539 RepID=A0A0K8IWM3_9CAUD|nr:internal virion protein [Cronobacter phage Dev-CD-23823]CUH74613.1 hypothetical protein [Cronobacter phage Dev-CD-23823]